MLCTAVLNVLWLISLAFRCENRYATYPHIQLSNNLSNQVGSLNITLLESQDWKLYNNIKSLPEIKILELYF